ncbi:MAG: hypothetical protein IT368_13865 [Candidatus Hydrogenedentes bacterium]|nr:hypothetical protein [Candidatus Hydrogenedentota bacterium]
MVVAWKRKGSAVVGTLRLNDGRAANAVLVGPRQNPNGAVIVSAGPSGTETLPLPQALELLAPPQVVDILCMQERIFGDRGLPVPDELPA